MAHLTVNDVSKWLEENQMDCTYSDGLMRIYENCQLRVTVELR